jgi:hypothetical protein
MDDKKIVFYNKHIIKKLLIKRGVDVENLKQNNSHVLFNKEDVTLYKKCKTNMNNVLCYNLNKNFKTYIGFTSLYVTGIYVNDTPFSFNLNDIESEEMFDDVVSKICKEFKFKSYVRCYCGDYCFICFRLFS